MLLFAYMENTQNEEQQKEDKWWWVWWIIGIISFLMLASVIAPYLPLIFAVVIAIKIAQAK